MGLGELIATSVAPAIADPVYYAIGTRVREPPITVEELLQSRQLSPERPTAGKGGEARAALPGLISCVRA